jgi:hypothetical protein
MDRLGVLWDGSGCQEVWFLIGCKNFEDPECVDIENSKKVARVIRL